MATSAARAQLKFAQVHKRRVPDIAISPTPALHGNLPVGTTACCTVQLHTLLLSMSYAHTSYVTTILAGGFGTYSYSKLKFVWVHIYSII